MATEKFMLERVLSAVRCSAASNETSQVSKQSTLCCLGVGNKKAIGVELENVYTRHVDARVSEWLLHPLDTQYVNALLRQLILTSTPPLKLLSEN